MSVISETEIKSLSKVQSYMRGYKDGKTDALKDQCYDCISRQEVMHIVLSEFEGWPTDGEVLHLKRLTKKIDDLPSITHTNKKGHWISYHIAIPLSDAFKDCEMCSVCGSHNDYSTKYCPNCGSKMEE